MMNQNSQLVVYSNKLKALATTVVYRAVRVIGHRLVELVDFLLARLLTN
jgi:hypothetical protein